MPKIAAWLYTIVAAGLTLFQLALAAGAPWGEFAMGGAFPGQFPPTMRVAAVIQAALIIGMVTIVLTRAEIFFAGWVRRARWLIWVVVGYGVIGLILNVITPSAGERALWVPVALVMLVSSVIVARGTATPASTS
ncbi:MAG: hypothetical protein SH847_14095 [Roseiflexaceae bacterium]|nr:hypothetical protein [Roseiflexaceae bacterium]